MELVTGNGPTSKTFGASGVKPSACEASEAIKEKGSAA
jgi:hypothetical protein